MMAATMAFFSCAGGSRAFAERPQVLWSQAGHSEMVLSVGVPPDGSCLVSSSSDGTVKVWDPVGGALRYSVRAFGPMALAPNDGRIAIQTGTGVQIRQLSDGALIRTVAGNNFARPSWSPDGQRIIAANAGNTLRLSDVQSGQAIYTLTGHTALVRCTAFSPDGAFVVSGAGLAGADNTVRIWSAGTGQQLRVLTGHTEYIGCVAVSPDAEIIASGSGDRTVKLWDASTGALLRTLSGSATAVWDVDFSPDGQRVAAATIGGPVRIWNVGDGVEQPPIAVLYGARSASYGSDGQLLTVGTQMGFIELRRTADGALLDAVGAHHRELSGPRYSSDGRKLAFGDDQLHLTRLRARDGAMIDQQSMTGFLNDHGAVISPDASSAAILDSADTDTLLWNLDTQSAGLQLAGHVSVIFASAFSPDGRLFATAGEYQSGLWNVSTGVFVHWFQDAIPHSHAAVAFSFDSSRVALSDRGRAKVFDVTTAALLHDFNTGLFELSSIAISPDGSTVAAAGTNQVWCWRLATNSVAWTSATTIGRASGLQFTRDGRHIFLAGSDGYVQVRRALDGSVAHGFDQEMGAGVTGLALSPTGRTFAYTRTDATMIVARNPVWTLGDIDGDGCVTLGDLATLLADFGDPSGPPPTDLNEDGAIDLLDLSALLSNFGACE